MEEVLDKALCKHAVTLGGTDKPFYAVLMKIGSPFDPVMILEPSEKHYLIKMKDGEVEDKIMSGICLNELLDMLTISPNFGTHDLVILDSCPCEQ